MDDDLQRLERKVDFVANLLIGWTAFALAIGIGIFLWTTFPGHDYLIGIGVVVAFMAGGTLDQIYRSKQFN